MMEPEVDVTWQGAEDEPASLLASTHKAALALLRALLDRAEVPGAEEGPVQLSVLLTDDAGIQPLNAQWRSVDRPTDVLSFPMEEGPLLGDVVISVETAQARLAGQDWSLEEELLFLLVHGVLHLLGYDHIEEQDRLVMEKAEQELWTALGGAGTLRSPEAK